MSKRSKFAKKRKKRIIEWLPVDSRLLPPIFAFGHVTGIARIFLEIEIILSVVIVAGTFVLLFFSIY